MKLPAMPVWAAVLLLATHPVHSRGDTTIRIISVEDHYAAGTELRRYLYLLTGTLPAYTHSYAAATLPNSTTNLTAYSAANNSYSILLTTTSSSSLSGPHDHLLHSDDDANVTICMGSTLLATKYAVFSLLEVLGIRFRLHGQDAVPRVSGGAGAVIETLRNANLQMKRYTPGKVEIRGMQPFHDFSEGPDQWNEDNYKVHMEQMIKLKMNFIGLHTYAGEPTVWTGTTDQFNPATGDPNSSNYDSYETTGGGGDWGGVKYNSTDGYIFGAHQLFAGGNETPYCYGSDLLDGHGSCMPPGTRDFGKRVLELYSTVGHMLGRAFAWGRSLGIKTCVGTETVLSKPYNRPNATSQELYTGMFRRIMATMPIDYYWLWTKEGWGGRHDPTIPVTNPFITDAVADFMAAEAAHKAVNPPFELATCGWTLGPASNRSYFDAVLPPSWTITSINEAVGNTPTEAEYKNVTKHKKWAIPWMEDDPGLLVPQFWVNRTLEYSAQAAEYGVDGLLGIHWRVQEVSPQFTALAAFPWNQTLTAADHWRDFFTAEIGATAGPKAAEIMSAVDSYNFPRPDTWITGPGSIVPSDAKWNATQYAFVDRFLSLEQEAAAAGPAEKYRFDFWANSLRYLRSAARLGIAWGAMNVCLEAAGPSVCHANESIGCFKDCPHVMPTIITANDEAVTPDWCANQCAAQNMSFAGVEFGGACFCSKSQPDPDGSKKIACPSPEMPCKGNATEGCGGNCILHAYTFACTPVPRARQQALVRKCLPLWDQMVALGESTSNYILATVATTGTMGTIQNFQQHNVPKIFNATLETLVERLGGPLPASSALPTHAFTGKERLFVITARQSISRGEPVLIRAFVLVADNKNRQKENSGTTATTTTTNSSTDDAASAVAQPILHARPMGGGSAGWTSIVMQSKMAGRTVFETFVPSSLVQADFEYYLSWTGTDPQITNHVWPAGAPAQPHTVVVVSYISNQYVRDD